MPSFMGRTTAGASAVVRALSPLGKSSSTRGGRIRNARYLSMANLRALHSELVVILDDVPTAHSHGERSKRDARLVEIIRSIAELVAFGETGDTPEFFEFFCEKAIMASFVEALGLGPAIQTQVVQAISILFQNLQSLTSLYMLLSQDHINRLIQPELGAAELPLHDEEFLSNYVALLKAISVRLSKETVQFFLNAAKGSFPLYSRAVPLIAHTDPMVRTSALNITLHVFSVKDLGVKTFLALEENYGGFFSQLSRLLQGAYSQILCRVWQMREPSEEHPSMESATTFFQDMLYYVQDLLDATDEDSMAERLALHLHGTFFRPIVLEGLAEILNEGDEQWRRGQGQGQAATATATATMASTQRKPSVIVDKEPEVQLALYALCQFFLVTTSRNLVKLVAGDLLGFNGPRNGRSYTASERCAVPAPASAEMVQGDSVLKSCEASSAENGVGEEPLGSSRYRRAFLSCMARRDGGQVRLGAVVLVRCLVKSLLKSGIVCSTSSGIDSSAKTCRGDREIAVEGEAGRVTQGAGEAAGSRVEESVRAAVGGVSSGLARKDHFGDGRGAAATVSSKELACGRVGALFSEAMKLEQDRRPVTSGGEVHPSGDNTGGRNLAGSEAARADEVSEAKNRGRAVDEMGNTAAWRRKVYEGINEAKSRAKIMRDICVNFRKVAQSPFGYATAVIQAWRDGTLARLRCHSIMIGLLQTLARHPVIRTVDVHTAAAALEELIQLENCLVPRCSAASFDLGVNSTTCGLSFSSEDSNNPSTAWASGLEPEEQWRIAMLKNAYAESAEVLLRITTDFQPFALLAAFEHAVELLVNGSTTTAGITRGYPPPSLGEVAGIGLLMDDESQQQLPGALRSPNTTQLQRAIHVQAYLVLRSMYERLVENGRSPSGHRVQTLSSSCCGTVCLDPDILALAGIDMSPKSPGGGWLTAPPRPGREIDGARAEKIASGVGRAENADERDCGAKITQLLPGSRVRLSGKRCVACRLPQNWPTRHPPIRSSIISHMAAKRVAPIGSFPRQAPNPSEGLPWRERAQYLPQSQPRELYALLDESSLVLAAPDPVSMENGLLACAAPLRNVVARPHPADSRVLELRVSTRASGGAGPGLFLPVVATAASRPSDRPANGADFRGAGHRGLWHLVLVFETAAACSLVAEHVEERREAIVAERTVGLVEKFRRTTGLRSYWPGAMS